MCREGCAGREIVYLYSALVTSGNSGVEFGSGASKDGP